MDTKTIINPLTKRKIEKGGATHKKLIKEGILTESGSIIVKKVSSKKVNLETKSTIQTKHTDRICGPNVSLKNPNAYTKEELVDMAIKNLNMTKSAATKLKKEELCKLLSLLNGSTKKTTKKITKKITKKEDINKEEKPPSVIIKKSKSVEVPIATMPIDENLSKVPCIERSKIKLLPHQIRVVEYMKKHRGLIVCHSVGSGKTLTAVTSSQCYLDSNPQGKVVVITPVSLQGNFKKEMDKYGVTNKNRYDFYTYQGFFNKYKDTKNFELLMKNTYLIIDEVHNLRTKIKKTKKGEVMKINKAYIITMAAKNAQKTLLLSATPFYNEILDLQNLTEMVTGETMTKAKFKKAFNDHPMEFQHMMACLFSFYTVKKNEFYPSLTEKNVYIKMTENYFEHYKNIEMQNSEFYSSNPFKFYTGVRMACNFIAECIKCDFVVDLVKKGKKILIYSAFKTKGLELLKERLNTLKIKYYEITGETKMEDRTDQVDRYNAEEEGIKVFFVTKAGGEGLDLKGTRDVVIFESNWNRPNEEQIIGRANRYMSHTHLPESERNVTVWKMIIKKPSIEEMELWGGKNYGYAGVPSADIILQGIIDEKIGNQQKFVDLVSPVSIEQYYCP